MKTSGRLAVIAMVVLGWSTSFGQSVEPEVPGDHFSLEGALELFKKSASPQEFEKMLNSPDSKVNNLDLNGDGYIDYIRVLDRYEGNVHAFILQAVVSEREYQDVAVIELEKLANGKAVLQIIGDEDVYGVTTIIEPTREVRTYAGTTSTQTVVNVWAWPSVQYIYGPYYAAWVSPWGWYRRPVWYRAWRPIAYVHYYPIWRPYRTYYVPCYTRRVVYAHEIYRPYRTTSVVVRTRHHDQLTRYRSERRDDNRNRRSRDDDRRAYVNNSRSTTNIDRRREDENLSGRRAAQREGTTISDRSASRERTISTAPQRNSTEIRRNESSNRRPVTIPANRERYQQVTRPSTMNRSRSTEIPDMQQRSSTGQRNLQRNSGNVQRSTSPAIRQEVNRPATVNRSRPAASPNMQRTTTPRRSTATVPSNRSVRQPAGRPSTVNSSRSSGSPKVQQRSSPSRSTGATRSSGIKRGRQ